MFELSQEETLMYASDNSVTLTTHRVIQQTEKIRKQVMLEDFESYELKSKNIGNYKLLIIFFSIISLILIILRLNEYFEYEQLMSQIRLKGSEENVFLKLFQVNIFDYMFTAPIVFSLFLLGTSFLFFSIAKRKIVRINGRYSLVEFRVRDLNNISLQKFLKTLIEESDKRKRKDI